MRYAYLDTPEVGWVLQFLFPKRWEGESAAIGTPLSLCRARNFPPKPKSDVPIGALWCAIVEGFDAPLSVHSGETRPLSPHTTTTNDLTTPQDFASRPNVRQRIARES